MLPPPYRFGYLMNICKGTPRSLNIAYRIASMKWSFSLTDSCLFVASVVPYLRKYPRAIVADVELVVMYQVRYKSQVRARRRY